MPEIDNVEQAITDATPEDVFDYTIRVIRMLKAHAEHSSLVKEIFDNAGKDFLHGINPKDPAHQGSTILTLSTVRINNSYSWKKTTCAAIFAI